MAEKFLIALVVVGLISSGASAERLATVGPLALRSLASESPSLISRRSKIYEAGSNRSKPLFTMVREERTENGINHVSEIYRDASGAEVIHAQTTIDHGKFVEYSVDQKQLGDHGSIRLSDGKLHFEYVRNDGKTKRDVEDWQDNFVVSSVILHYVAAHWSDLLAGHDVNIRLGVPERTETVGFKFFKDKEIKRDGKDVVVAEMKPKSFIIAALVKPLYFYIDKQSGKLLEFDGRVLPKIKDGDRWKDLDAESVYEE